MQFTASVIKRRKNRSLDAKKTGVWLILFAVTLHLFDRRLTRRVRDEPAGKLAKNPNLIALATTKAVGSANACRRIKKLKSYLFTLSSIYFSSH
jgi:hypothetical protein